MCRSNETCILKSDKALKYTAIAASAAAAGLLCLYVIRQVKISKKDNNRLVKVKYKFSKDF